MFLTVPNFEESRAEESETEKAIILISCVSQLFLFEYEVFHIRGMVYKQLGGKS